MHLVPLSVCDFAIQPVDARLRTVSAQVRINRHGADRVASGHPWIFQSDVIEKGDAQPGDAVRVVNQQGRLLGTAHFSASSQITLRLLSPKQEIIDDAFWCRRIASALSHRQRVVSGSNSYRLIHAEADGLPGLIVDRYGDYLVVQTLTQGMDRAKAEIVSALEKLIAPKGIVERNDSAIRDKENLPRQTGILTGDVPAPVMMEMNGLHLEANLLEGQKTGVFLDQRENYLAAARWAKGQVLDCFTSTGGFALHMAAKADAVEAVDSSERALATATRNRDANGITNIKFREADVFNSLAGYNASGRRFDTIVIDPPAFAKSNSQLAAAEKAYRDLNRRALSLLNPGGVLISCSCSQHMSEALLFDGIAQASIETGRPLRVLERRIQSMDHPVLLTVPETLYLKCLILELV